MFHCNLVQLTRQVRHVREAWEFVKLLTSYEAGVQAALAPGAPPGGRPDVWTDPRLDDVDPVYRLAGEQLLPEARPATVAYNLRTKEIHNTYERLLPEIFLNRMAPALGLRSIAGVLQAILDRPR